MATTTITVSVELRDRIDRGARERGVTAAGLLELLLDAHERQQRMEAFGRAIRGADAAYWDDFHSWDVTLDEPVVTHRRPPTRTGDDGRTKRWDELRP